METVGDRLNKLLETLNIKKVDFAKELDRSTGNISDWLSNKCNPGKRALKIMNEKFDVSAKWLIEGEGDMFVNKKINQPITHDIRGELLPHIINPLGDLSEEEINVIKLFRQLDERERAKIEGMLEIKVAEAQSIKR